MTEDDVEIIEKTTPFKGYFQIDRYRLRHRLFEGGWSGEMVREVFERGHAVAVLLLDPVLDRVVLIEQFRPGAFAALVRGGFVAVAHRDHRWHHRGRRIARRRGAPRDA